MGLGDTGIQDRRLLLEVVVRRLRLAVLERLLRDQLDFLWTSWCASGVESKRTWNRTNAPLPCSVFTRLEMAYT